MQLKSHWGKCGQKLDTATGNKDISSLAYLKQGRKKKDKFSESYYISAKIRSGFDIDLKQSIIVSESFGLRKIQ